MGEEGLRLDPARTALLVVDMQNDFCSPRGAFGAGGKDVSAFTATIPPVARLLARCRDAGCTIAFTRILWPDGRSPRDHAGAIRPRLSMLVTGRAIQRGSWGGEIVEELAPQADEIVVDKAGMSGFHGTDLDARLKARGVTTLILCGVVTYACVLATALAARDHDYNVVMPRDAVGSFFGELNGPVFHITDLLLGHALPQEAIAFIGA